MFLEQELQESNFKTLLQTESKQTQNIELFTKNKDSGKLLCSCLSFSPMTLRVIDPDCKTIAR